MAPHSGTVARKIPWMEEPGRLQSMGSLGSRTWLSDFTFTFNFHALEKEMGTHSSVLAWRIPWTEKPGRLQSMGSHRVGHDWSDLAAAEDPIKLVYLCNFFKQRKDCIILTEPCTAYWRTAWPLLYPVQRTGLQHHPQSGPCMFNMDYGSRLGRQSQNHLVGTDAVGERETYNSEMGQYI